MKRLLVFLALAPALSAGPYFVAQTAWQIKTYDSVYRGDYLYGLTLTSAWNPANDVFYNQIVNDESTPKDSIVLFDGFAQTGEYTNPQGIFPCCDTFFGFMGQDGGYIPPSFIPSPGIRNFVLILSTDPHLTITSNGVTTYFPLGRPDFERSTGFLAPGSQNLPEPSAASALGAWAAGVVLWFLYDRKRNRR